jgi:hypothetical protein
MREKGSTIQYCLITYNTDSPLSVKLGHFSVIFMHRLQKKKSYWKRSTAHHFLWKITFLICWIWGSHNSGYEGRYLHGCNTMYAGRRYCLRLKGQRTKWQAEGCYSIVTFNNMKTYNISHRLRQDKNEDGGSRFPQKVGTHPPDYMASHHKRTKILTFINIRISNLKLSPV